MAGLDWLTARPIAHRGLHGPGAVENTPTAFNAAIAAGYAIETDLQITADADKIEAAIQRNPVADRPAAGAARASM